MTNRDTMLTGAVTFILIAWTLSLVFLMYKMDKDMNYLSASNRVSRNDVKTNRN